MARLKRRTSQQVRDEAALLEALEPIEQAHLDAKAAFKQARASGDREAFLAARKRKQATGNHLNEVRTWLRREDAIRRLQAITIPKLEQRLAGPILAQDGPGRPAREDTKTRKQLETMLERARTELAELSRQAADYRAQLEQLGGVVGGDPVPPDLPPGSAEVELPTIQVKADINGRRGRGRA